jgi:hypothetical protein
MGALILVIIFFLPGGILGFIQEKVKGRRETIKEKIELYKTGMMEERSDGHRE